MTFSLAVFGCLGTNREKLDCCFIMEWRIALNFLCKVKNADKEQFRTLIRMLLLIIWYTVESQLETETGRKARGLRESRWETAEGGATI